MTGKNVNKLVAEKLRQYAVLLQQDGERNRFRLNSYRKGAKIIEELTTPITEIEFPSTIRGIGTSLAVKIKEIIASGDFKERTELAKVHVDVTELLKIPNVGPAKATAMAEVFKENDLEPTIENLKKLLAEGKITLPKNVLMGLEMLEKSQGRIRLDKAMKIAEPIIEALKPLAVKIDTAGSLRRCKESIGDIDIMMIPTSKAMAKSAFEKMGDNVLESGVSKASIDLGGVRVDLRFTDEDSWGAAMLYFTGSKNFNIAMRTVALKKGWLLNEDGLFNKDGKMIAGKTEEEVCEKLDLPYVIPEMRDYPETLTTPPPGGIIWRQDFDLHIHTTFSDGANTVAEMVAAAWKQGYEFIGIADHSQRMFGKFTDDKAREQWAEIDAIRDRFRFPDLDHGDREDVSIEILRGIEVEIMGNGSLDSGILEEFDYAIASLHYAGAGEDVTKRYLAAIKHPTVKILAHLTGRKVEKRPAWQADYDKIFKECAANGVALEINGQPDRLDLPPDMIRRAKEFGCKFVLGSDAHSTNDLDLLQYAVMMARKAGLTKADIIDRNFLAAR